MEAENYMNIDGIEPDKRMTIDKATPQIKILSPCFMKDFLCTCTACEDNCCSSWNIDIDYETYKKYRNEKEPDLKELFDKYLIMNGNPSGRNDYAKIILNPDLFCPFLTEDRYCLIQLRKGQEYQSKICRTFPRIHHVINGVLEESVTLACPEAARLALLRPDGIEFYEREAIFCSEYYIRNVLDTNNPFFDNLPAKYFLQLRSFTIKVIKNRRHSLYNRLILLGMFFQKADANVKEGKSDHIPQLIDSYTEHSPDSLIIVDKCEIPVSGTKQIFDLIQLLNSKFTEKIEHPDYFELFSKVLLGIGFTSTGRQVELGEKYDEAYHKYYLPYMNEHGYILENFLVNHVFKILFPFSAGYQSLFEKYVKLVLQYTLLRIQLIGLSGFYRGLTDNIVIKLVYNYIKEIEHSSSFLENLYFQFKQNNHTSMEDIFMLLKN